MKPFKRILFILTASALLAVGMTLPAFASQSATLGGSQITTIAAGDSTTYAVKADGSLWGCGANHSSQLKVGEWTINTPTMLMETGVKACAAGNDHVLILKTDGTVWAWGKGAAGQIGAGGASGSGTPVQVMSDVRAIAAAGDSSFAIKNDNTLWAWGENGDGQLGIGNASDSYTPVQVTDNVSTVAAGISHTLVVKKDNALYATGRGKSGQIGNGLTGSRTTLVRIMGDVQSVSAGYNHSLAIKTDNSLWAWGDNSFGQLGDGTLENKLEPVKIADEVHSIAAGQFFTLAVKNDAGIFGWGRNSGRQLGNGGGGNMTDIYGYACQSTPIKISGYGEAVAAGRAFSLVLKTDKTMWGWGDNASGQIGDGAINTWSIIAPVLTGVGLPELDQVYATGGSVSPNTPQQLVKTATPAKVTLNGVTSSIPAYNISDNNYVKLRDIAAMLNGTNAQFNVGYDNTAKKVLIETNTAYTPVGGELLPAPAAEVSVKVSSLTLSVNGIDKTFSACNVAGNNYIKLRDIASAVNFSILFDEVNFAVVIDPLKPYAG